MQQWMQIGPISQSAFYTSRRILLRLHQMRFAVHLEDCVVLVVELANISTVVVIAHGNIATIAVAAPSQHLIPSICFFTHSWPPFVPGKMPVLSWTYRVL